MATKKTQKKIDEPIVLRFKITKNIYTITIWKAFGFDHYEIKRNKKVLLVGGSQRALKTNLKLHLYKTVMEMVAHDVSYEVESIDFK